MGPPIGYRVHGGTLVCRTANLPVSVTACSNVAPPSTKSKPTKTDLRMEKINYPGMVQSCSRHKSFESCFGVVYFLSAQEAGTHDEPVLHLDYALST